MQRHSHGPTTFSLFSLLALLAVLTAEVRADEPAAADNPVAVRGEAVRADVVGRSIFAGFLDIGYARVSREDWTPPRDFRIHRAPAVYSRSYPERFYGQAGPSTTGPIRRYSIIPNPTDTTQLGYYYRRVPVWQPRMLPPIPRPSRWHDRTPLPSMRSRERTNRAPAPQMPPAAPNTQARLIPGVIR